MSGEKWTEGYVVGLEYLQEYFPEIAPHRVSLALLQAGFAPPEIDTACELGFGQGVSIVVHGTAGATVWWGNDFMPGQVANAQRLARAGGAPVTLLEDAFVDLAGRSDLPMFDFVALHGVWSWVSAANRAAIVELLRRRLKPGGVVYVSYNVRAGWGALAMVQHLLKQFIDRQTPPAMVIPAKIDAGLEFIERMLATSPAYAVANPQLAVSLNSLKTMSRHYLAHEFLHADCRAFDFAEVAGDLTEAKLSFVGSANLLDAMPALGLTPHQAAFLDAIDDPVLRQTSRDVMVNQMFRRDIFVRGPQALAPLRRSELVRALKVVLIRPPAEVRAEFSGAQGIGALKKADYLPILDHLADLAGHEVGELFDHTAAAGATLGQTFDAICVLVTKGDIDLVQADAAIAAARPRTDALNAHLLDRARIDSDIAILASPVTGGGIAVDHVEKFFLCSADLTSPAACAERAWEILAARGRSLVRDGQTLVGRSQNLPELLERAEAFLANRLPQLRALGIAPPQ